MISRRRLILMSAALVAAPRFSGAQAQPLRIGWLAPESAAMGAVFYDAFREGLAQLGYEQGRNAVLTARWGEGRGGERLDELAAELVRSCDVIVAQGGRAIVAVRQATTSIPIVFSASGDPVEAGHANSLARPGRNLTGISLLSLDLAGKRMQLLKEALPAIRRVAVVANPEHAGQQSEIQVSQAAAKSLGVAIDYFPARTAGQVDAALERARAVRSEAIVAFPDGVLMAFSERFARFSIDNRVPTISGWAQFAERGNVLSYGPNLRDSFRRLAFYVDRIAKGASPSNTPIELPKTVELVVNRATARAAGFQIPQTVFLRADRIID